MINQNFASIVIESGNSTDLPSFRELFKEVVLHTEEHYSVQQIKAWATAATNDAYWASIFQTNHFIKAMQNEQLAGFASYSSQGEVDHLYVLPSMQHQGIGSLLLKHLEERAKIEQIRVLKTDASLYSRNLFLKMGFHTLREYEKTFAGARFTNTLMEKTL